MTRLKRSEDGQSLLEWSIVLPIILVFLFALIDFSFIMYQKHTLDQLTKETARGASIGMTADALRTEADRIGDTLFPVSSTSYAEATDASGKRYGQLTLAATDGRSIVMTFQPALSQRTKGAPIRVSLEYTYRFLTPVLSEIDGVILRSAYVTLVEYVPKT